MAIQLITVYLMVEAFMRGLLVMLHFAYAHYRASVEWSVPGSASRHLTPYAGTRLDVSPPKERLLVYVGEIYRAPLSVYD